MTSLIFAFSTAFLRGFLAGGGVYAASGSDHISGYTSLYGFCSPVIVKQRCETDVEPNWLKNEVHITEHRGIFAVCAPDDFTVFNTRFSFYPLEGPELADRSAGSRSWPTRSSAWFESLLRQRHRLSRRKERAFPPLYWPPMWHHTCDTPVTASAW